MVCVVCDGLVGCEFCPRGWTPEASVTILARRLVNVDAGHALVVAAGEAFGHATGALLSEMRRVREAPCHA